MFSTCRNILNIICSSAMGPFLCLSGLRWLLLFSQVFILFFTFLNVISQSEGSTRIQWGIKQGTSSLCDLPFKLSHSVYMQSSDCFNTLITVFFLSFFLSFFFFWGGGVHIFFCWVFNFTLRPSSKQSDSKFWAQWIVPAFRLQT